MNETLCNLSHQNLWTLGESFLPDSRQSIHYIHRLFGIQNQLSYFWFPLWKKTLLTSLTNIWLIWTNYNVGRRWKRKIFVFYTSPILTIPILEIHFQNFTFKASSFEWNRSDWISTQILLQWMRARLNWLIHNFRILLLEHFIQMNEAKLYPTQDTEQMIIWKCQHSLSTFILINDTIPYGWLKGYFADKCWRYTN